MSAQITLANLQAVVDRINRQAGSPATPYTRDEAGKYTANIGNYHLSQCYGGVSLHRMENSGGGVSDVLRIGHVPKRTLYDAMHAFLAGMDAASERAA